MGCAQGNINLGDSTQCVATVTDDILLDSVSANVTLPNGTIETQNVTNISSNFFFTFTNSVLISQYNVTWFANDSSSNTQTGTDSFNVSDVVSPNTILNTPVGAYNSSSTEVSFNFTVTDDALSTMNCSIIINDTINQTNSSTVNGTTTLFNITGFAEGDYNWKVNCSDESNNSNISETRLFTVDTSTPNFISLTTNPSTDADLDPRENITIYANITDNITGIDTAILQRKLSTDSTYTNLTLTYNETSLLFEGTFNASQNGTYNLRLWANDSAGNDANSNLVNISVQFERTWTRFPSALTPISATFGENVTLGNLSINNTGDFTFNFTIVSDSNVTLYNDTENFTLAAEGVKVLQINDTATETGVKTVTLNISVNDTNANPTSLTTAGTIVVAPGQPILVATFTTPTTETLTQTQGDTNIEFVAKLENIGEGNATNVTFSINLPSEWTVTFGSINGTFSTLNTGESEELSIEVTIPSDATAGAQDVIVNATGYNQSGTDLETLGLIFSDTVEVTIEALPTELGVAEEPVTPTPSGGSAAAGGGVGSGGGGAGTSVLKTIEVIKVKRGTSQTVPFEIKNIYENATLTNVRLELEGFMSQYISWTPEILNDIAYLDSKNFIFTIFVPDYFSEADYNLTATVVADLIPLNPKVAGYSKKSVKEVRTVVLRVHELDVVDLSKEMKKAEFPTSKVEDLLSNAGEAIGDEDYTEAKSLLEEICKIKKKSFDAYELILILEEKIKDAEEKGLDVPDTKDELELAKIAFNREDFGLSVQRAKDAELIYVFETKGKFNVIEYVKDHWARAIFGLVILSLFAIFGGKKIRIWLIKRKIKNLYKEEQSIYDLIREAQLSYIKDKKISETQYNRYIKQYEERLSKIKQERITLRNKKVAMMDTKQEMQDLKKERKEVQKQLKMLQNKYFIQKNMTKTQFNSDHKSNRLRLTEINAEEQILKRRLKQKKKSKTIISGINKITNIEFYTNIFKNKKNKRKIRRRNRK